MVLSILCRLLNQTKSQIQNSLIKFVSNKSPLRPYRGSNRNHNDSKNERAIQTYKVQIASAVVVMWYSSDVSNVVVAILKEYNPGASSVESSFNQFIDTIQQSKSKSCPFFCYLDSDQECCGWESAQDYKANENLNSSNSDNFSRKF